MAAAAALAATAAAAPAQPKGNAPEIPGARAVHEERSPSQQAAIDRVAAELAAIEARIAASRGQEKTLLGEVARFDLDVARAQAREEASSLAAEEQARKARAAKERAAALARRLDATRARVAIVLEALYRSPPREGVAALIAGDGERGGAEGGASVLARRQIEIARELDDARRASQRAAQEAISRARSAEILGDEARLRAAEAREARGHRKRELDALASDRKRAVELEEESALAQAGLLGQIERARPDSPATRPESPVAPIARVPRTDLVGLDALRGRLPWPLADRGRIAGAYGEVVNPRHGTRTPRHGLVLEAPEGTPIRAIAEGRVEFVDWFKGFGRCLVIDHGGGWMSVSAHASAFTVGPGDDVVAGQVVGAVGDTGSLDGPRLYFQMSRGSEPVNPIEWLER